MNAAEPPRDCPRCPRLVAFREAAREREPSWHNAPVPSFGSDQSPLLIVGLAPGLRGANRTGRPFTGDWAGDLLYETLLAQEFATGQYDERPDDGLALIDCTITNAVRCVPPENKPTRARRQTVDASVRARSKASRPVRDAWPDAFRQLSLLPIQYEHGRANAADVPRRLQGCTPPPRARLSSLKPSPSRAWGQGRSVSAMPARRERSKRPRPTSPRTAGQIPTCRKSTIKAE